MTDEWLARWNNRYAEQEYAFGEEPNFYLKKQLGKLPPGKILFPAEGEGRNAVYAARLGWEVSAFDISVEGQRKALQLAARHGVRIDYQVGDLQSINFPKGHFDVLALIYAHFPSAVKSMYHKSLEKYISSNGHIIFEAYSKAHVANIANNPSVGGPSELAMLFSTQEIRDDFPGYEFNELREEHIDLHEGKYHNGHSSVIRAFGRKR